MNVDVEKNLRLIYTLTGANLKSRYRDTIYGFLWVLMNPVLTYGVQVFAFTTIFQVKFPNYSLYFLGGLFPWLFIVQSIEMCTGIFIYNGSIIKNIPISPFILVFVQILDNFINFISAFLLIILYYFFHGPLSAMSLLFLLIPLFSLLIAVSSLCLTFSLLNVYFRDLKFVVSFVFSLLFYLTPIFYSIDLVPVPMKKFIGNNPFYYLIHPFQKILTTNNFVMTDFFSGYIFAFILLLIAYISWSKMKHHLVFYV